MADGVFNVSKGRVAELYKRVDDNDPTNSVILVTLFLGSQPATLNDEDTIAAVEATAMSESTDGSYARKSLSDSDLAYPGPDDTNNRMDIGDDLADQTWTGLSGETLTTLIVCYDPDSTGTAESEIIPLTSPDRDWETNDKGSKCFTT